MQDYPKPVGHLYVIQADDGPVKIGISARPKQRLAEIASASGRQFSRIFVSHKISDPRSVEVRLHEHFREWRTTGEWFCVEFETAVRAADELLSCLVGPGGEQSEHVLRGFDIGKRFHEFRAMPGVTRQHLNGFLMALGPSDCDSIELALRSRLLALMSEILSVHEVLVEFGIPDADGVINRACEKAGITRSLEQAADDFAALRRKFEAMD